MTEVQLTEDTLIVHVVGWDRIWALKSRLEIPLSHVLGAEVDPSSARGRRGLKLWGTYVPGVITAGTFYRPDKRERVFWNVRNPEKAIVVRLRDERYARLVIEVEDPNATVETIRQALGGLRK